MFVLFYYIILLVPYALMFLGSGILSSVATGIVFIFALVSFIPSLAVTIRRLHDTNRSGWWLLISFIPLIGTIVLIVFLSQDSYPGTNAWGPNPKGIGGDQMDMEGVLDADF